jgi:ectoine hydroxylase-related dioxygenase (phytanoyl-CoA dioxygenase family)
MAHPAVRSFAAREELLAIARPFVGARALPYRATLFEKSGLRNWLVVWHQDTTLPLTARTDSAEWGPWSVKEGVHYAQAPGWALEKIVALRVHLDASTTTNGPLRVLPGSHQWGVLSDEEVFRRAREYSAVECIAPRGSVLAMRPLLVHASSKAERDASRRVLHVEYAASLEIGPGLQLAMA